MTTIAESRNGGYEHVNGTLRKRTSKMLASSADQMVRRVVCSRAVVHPHRYTDTGNAAATTQGRMKVSITLRTSGMHSCAVLSSERRKIQLARRSVGMSKTNRRPTRMQ